MIKSDKGFHVYFPAGKDLEVWADKISELILEASKEPGSGLALRSPELIKRKIQENKAVVALTNSDNTLVGFCYVDTWQNDEYVVNSALIVHPEWRGKGIATLLKQELFRYAKKTFRNAKIFGLTTSEAVMKINQKLGYRVASYDKLTTDKGFWKGCESCVHYDELQRNDGRNCKCTGMIFDPDDSEHGPYANEEALCSIEAGD